MGVVARPSLADALPLAVISAIHQAFQFAALARDQQLRRRAVEPRSLQLTDGAAEFGDLAAQAQNFQGNGLVTRVAVHRAVLWALWGHGKELI